MKTIIYRQQSLWLLQTRGIAKWDIFKLYISREIKISMFIETWLFKIFIEKTVADDTKTQHKADTIWSDVCTHDLMWKAGQRCNSWRCLPFTPTTTNPWVWKGPIVIMSMDGWNLWVISKTSGSNLSKFLPPKIWEETGLSLQAFISFGCQTQSALLSDTAKRSSQVMHRVSNEIGGAPHTSGLFSHLLIIH